MKDLSLHILDIVENSIRAGAALIEISISEDEEMDLLTLKICDDGKGMDRETRRRAMDPFFTTKSGKRIGLGLSLLAQATKEADGDFELESTPGEGTRVSATFMRSHPDRKPLGDIVSTLQSLILAHQGIKFVYHHRCGAEVMEFDTRKVNEAQARQDRKPGGRFSSEILEEGGKPIER